MNNRRSLSREEKEFILKRDNYSCRYCGKTKGPFEFDHVYPVVRGGESVLENIVTACRRCNRKKHSTIGIWPPPIGYFEKKRVAPISLPWILIILGFMAFLQAKTISTLWYGHNGLPFVFIGLGFLFFLASIISFIYSK